MDSSTSVKVVFRSKPGNNKTGYLFIRTITNRKPKFKSLGLQVHLIHWDEDKQRVKSSLRDHYKLYNQTIDKALKELHSSYNNLASLNESKTVLMDYWMNHINVCGNVGTQANRQASYNWVEKFLRDKNFEGIKFRQLTPQIVEMFESYMQTNLATRTINTYMGYWKSVVNKAIKEQVVTYRVHPFINHSKLTNPNKKVRALTVKQVKSIMELQVKPLRAYYRDMFCFQILAGGMRARDLITLRWENIHINEDQFYLIYNQSKGKGKKQITYQLSHKALSFLDEILRIKEPNKMTGVDGNWKWLNILYNNLKKWEEDNKFNDFRDEDSDPHIVEWSHYDINTEKSYKLKNIKKSDIIQLSTKENIKMYTEGLTESYQEVLKRIISEYPKQFIFNKLMKNMVIPAHNNDAKIKNKLQGKIQNLNSQLKHICRELNIPEVTSHSSRHSHTQMLVDLGANLHHIQQSLGHSSLGTTQNYVNSLHTVELDKLSVSISSQF